MSKCRYDIYSYSGLSTFPMKRIHPVLSSSIKNIKGWSALNSLIGMGSGLDSSTTNIAVAAAASVPLVVINAGVHSMSLPFIGTVNFGIFYPLVLIPVAVVGVSTTHKANEMKDVRLVINDFTQIDYQKLLSII